MALANIAAIAAQMQASLVHWQRKQGRVEDELREVRDKIQQCEASGGHASGTHETLRG